MPSFARTIGAPVGRGGANRPQDVRTIKFMLNAVPASQGGPAEFLLEGSPLSELTEAIVAFQSGQFGSADGRVDVEGRSMRRLREFDTEPGPLFLPAIRSGKKTSGGKKRR